MLGSEQPAGTVNGQLLGHLDVVKGFAALRRRRRAGAAWADKTEPLLLALQLLGDARANFREGRIQEVKRQLLDHRPLT